jgi:hypothetical protein
MINSEPDAASDAGSQDEAVDAILRTGARGAVVLAGIATAIVIALWIAFYLLVFVPRGAAP